MITDSMSYDLPSFSSAVFFEALPFLPHIFQINQVIFVSRFFLVLYPFFQTLLISLSKKMAREIYFCILNFCVSHFPYHYFYITVHLLLHSLFADSSFVLVSIRH